jgi:hypothetical protein
VREVVRITNDDIQKELVDNNGIQSNKKAITNVSSFPAALDP